MNKAIKVSNERAIELGRMIVSFEDSYIKPYSFNGTIYGVVCNGFECELVVIDNKGCFYSEERL